MAFLLTALAFLWWWPVGLLALFLFARRSRWRDHAYLTEGAAMSNWECRMDRGDRWERKIARMQDRMDRMRSHVDRARGGGWFGSSSSGNRAFDDYRAETLKRLEEEQREFKDFLERLRLARDRSEFDQFMADRRGRPVEPDASRPEPPAA